jgi:GNAT superfamily N-acetyltransferase
MAESTPQVTGDLQPPLKVTRQLTYGQDDVAADGMNESFIPDDADVISAPADPHDPPVLSDDDDLPPGPPPLGLTRQKTFQASLDEPNASAAQEDFDGDDDDTFDSTTGITSTPSSPSKRRDSQVWHADGYQAHLPEREVSTEVPAFEDELLETDAPPQGDSFVVQDTAATTSAAGTEFKAPPPLMRQKTYNSNTSDDVALEHANEAAADEQDEIEFCPPPTLALTRQKTFETDMVVTETADALADLGIQPTTGSSAVVSGDGLQYDRTPSTSTSTNMPFKSKSDLLFSPAKAEDAERVTEVINSAYAVELGDTGIAFKSGDRTNLAEVQKWIRHPHKHTITVRDARGHSSSPETKNDASLMAPENIIGVYVYKLMKDEPKAFFGPLAVHPRVQGNGAGKLIVEEICERARSDNCTHVQIDTVDKRTDLIPWYEHLGFKNLGTRDFPQLSTLTRPVKAVIMERPL